MENQNISTARFAMAGLRIVGAATLTMCLVQCSAEQPSGTGGEDNLGSVAESVITYPHCGGIACVTNSNCAQPAVLPLCGDALSASCQSAVHECVWKIKIDVNCVCVEHDVRHCNIDPTTGGVQICTANGARTNTSWSACQAAPVCTP